MQPTQTATTEPATVITKVQQPSRPSSASAQPISYVVVDDQQPGTYRQLIFNPPSVATSQQEKTQHNTSGLSNLSLELFPVYYSTSRLTHHNHFHPLNFNQYRHQCPRPLIMNSQDLPASPASRVSTNQQISLHKSHQLAILRVTHIFQKQLFSSCCPKTKNHTIQHLHFSQIHKKIV